MTEILENLSNIISQNLWIAPIIALLAGVLTSFTPCALTTIPIIIGYVGGVEEKNTKKSFLLSLVFAVGNAITFTILGVIASFAGTLIGKYSSLWYYFLGILMILMALQTWGIFEIIPTKLLTIKSNKKGFTGAFIAGILGGLFSSACSTPVLIALLALVAQKGSVAWGILLLFLYSVGHGALAVITGTSIGTVQKIYNSDKYEKASKILKIIMGTIILLLGFYMFYIVF